MSAQQYARDGFCLVQRAVVPHEVLDGALLGMEALRRRERDDGCPLSAEELGVIHSSPTGAGDEASLCKLELPQLGSTGIRALVSLDAIGDEIARATGAEWVQVWWTQLLGKPPSNGRMGTNIGYHQDRNYWQSSWEAGSELLTAWVALSDVTEHSGPMQFIRGSHKWGLLQDCGFFHDQSLEQQVEACLSRAPKAARWEPVDAVLPVGGFSLHDNYTLHGSGPNHSNIYRRSLAIHVRTNRSHPTGHAGLTAFLDDLEVNPVIFGREAFDRDQRQRQVLAPQNGLVQSTPDAKL